MRIFKKRTSQSTSIQSKFGASRPWEDQHQVGSQSSTLPLIQKSRNTRKFSEIPIFDASSSNATPVQTFWGMGKAWRKATGKTFKQSLGLETEKDVARHDISKGRLSDEEKAIYNQLIAIANFYKTKIATICKTRGLSPQDKINQLKALKDNYNRDLDSTAGRNHVEFINSTAQRAFNSNVNPMDVTKIKTMIENGIENSKGVLLTTPPRETVSN